MSGNNTLGFDVMIQVDERAVSSLSAQSASLLAMSLGTVSHRPTGEANPPRSWSLTSARTGFLTVDLDGTAGDLSCTVRLSFTAVQLTLSDGRRIPLGSATISLSSAFSVTSDADNFFLQFAMALDDPADNAQCTIPPGALDGTGISSGQVTGWLLADVVATIASLPIPNPATIATVPRDSGALQLTDLQLKTAHDTTRGFGDRDVLALLISVAGGGPTDIGGVLPNLLPASSAGAGNLAFVLQNSFIENQVCAQVIMALGGTPNPTAPCSLPSPLRVTRNNQQFDLVAIATSVDDVAGTLNLRLSIHSSGVGYHVQGDITVPLRFQVMTSAGQANLVPVLAGPVTNDVQLYLEPWVWGLGLAVGIVVFVINPLVGIIVTVVILAVLAVITAILSGVVSGNVSSAAGGAVTGATSPLPSAIADLLGPSTTVGVTLDDLVIASRLTPRVPDPLYAAGVLVIPPGYTADLDTCTVLPGRPPSGSADLSWGSSGSALALTGINGARFAVAALAWLELSLTTVRGIALPRAARLDASRLPVGPAARMPSGAVVLVARTGSGRYAKLLAWRDAAAHLCLEVAVFDTPADEVHIAGIWREIAPRSYSGEGYDPTELATYREYTVRQQLAAIAEPTAMTPPISYAWSLNGAGLGASGTAGSSAGELDYTVDGPRCTLNLAPGNGFTGTLTVVATDSFGLVAAQTLSIDRPGVLRAFDTSAIQQYLQSVQYASASNLFINPIGPDPAEDVLRAALDGEQLRAATAAGMAETFEQAGLDLNQMPFR